MIEIQFKLQKMRDWLREQKADAVRLRGVDWFAWITAGGNSSVIFTHEKGIAEVLITAREAFIITNLIEATRLKKEEIPSDFEVVTLPWFDPLAIPQWIEKRFEKAKIFSDFPEGAELALPKEALCLRLILTEPEQQRLRKLGADAALAMTAALTQARPDWTEQELAGLGAKELWSRGIHPTLVLVAGEKRGPLYRHPFPTDQKIGGLAMMVFCGRRQGLYANLTRWICFRPLSDQEQEAHAKVAQLEKAAFDLTQEGHHLSEIFEGLWQIYREQGFAEEIPLQHFGGLTGYQSREILSLPTDNMSLDPALKKGMSLAWNPTFRGAKIEDTVLMGPQGLEIVSCDPQWPTQKVGGRLRPEVKPCP